MPKIARHEDYAGSAERGAENVTKIARSATQEGADAARESSERARNAASEVTEESAELGRSIISLLGEQTRHNMQFATAFGRTVDWGQVAEMQRDFLAGSFNRMIQLGDRYRTMLQAGMKPMAFTTRR